LAASYSVSKAGAQSSALQMSCSLPSTVSIIKCWLCNPNSSAHKVRRQVSRDKYTFPVVRRGPACIKQWEDVLHHNIHARLSDNTLSMHETHVGGNPIIQKNTLQAWIFSMHFLSTCRPRPTAKLQNIPTAADDFKTIVSPAQNCKALSAPWEGKAGRGLRGFPVSELCSNLSHNQQQQSRTQALAPPKLISSAHKERPETTNAFFWMCDSTGFQPKCSFYSTQRARTAFHSPLLFP